MRTRNSKTWHVITPNMNKNTTNVHKNLNRPVPERGVLNFCEQTPFFNHTLSFCGFSGDIEVQSESHPKDSLCYVLFWVSPRQSQSHPKDSLCYIFFLVSPRQSQSHPNESLWYAFSGSSIKSIMPLRAVLHLYIALEPSCICIYICVHRPLI